MPKALSLIVAVVCAALLSPAGAGARGGNYAFDGGTPRQQAQVRVALGVSRFDWGIVPERIVIHLSSGSGTYATRGEIWIDTDLLASGVFAWGPIQHEYAHQVDFFLLDEADRARLTLLLRGKAWSSGGAVAGFHRGDDHAGYGAERFASTLAWAYWRVPENSLRPVSAADEAAAMEPSRFRRLLAELLGVRDPSPPVITVGPRKR